MEKKEWFQKAVQAILDTDDEAAEKIATNSLESEPIFLGKHRWTR